MEWWTSIPKMERVTRVLITTAIVLFVLAVITWPLTWTVAIPAAVLAVTLVTCALFAWFRLDDLRGRQDYP